MTWTYENGDWVDVAFLTRGNAYNILFQGQKGSVIVREIPAELLLEIIRSVQEVFSSAQHWTWRHNTYDHVAMLQGYLGNRVSVTLRFSPKLTSHDRLKVWVSLRETQTKRDYLTTEVKVIRGKDFWPDDLIGWVSIAHQIWDKEFRARDRRYVVRRKYGFFNYNTSAVTRFPLGSVVELIHDHIRIVRFPQGFRPPKNLDSDHWDVLADKKSREKVLWNKILVPYDNIFIPDNIRSILQGED